MGGNRSRKTQFGSTNNDIKKQLVSTSLSLSSSSSLSQLLNSDISKSTLIENHVHTQKLLAPNLKAIDVERNPDKRNIKVISTWNQKDMYERQFASETNASFTDPEEIRQHTILHMAVKNKKALDEANLKVRAPLIFQKLGEESTRKYGGAAKMFKVIGNKETSDIITLTEMSDYFKKANLDETIPQTDQKYIFESLDEKGYGRIPVYKLLERVDIRDPQQVKDMSKIRNFLADEIEKSNVRSLSSSASESNILHSKSHEVDELMRRSMSQRTFDLEIDPISFNNLIEEKINDSTLNSEQTRIARYLRITNLQMNVVPFYDTRAEVISNLKEKSERVQSVLKEECEKLKKLQIIRKQLNDVNSNNTNELFDGLSVTQSLNEREFYDGRVSTSPARSRLMTTPINKRYLSKEGTKSHPRNLAGSINDANFLSESKIEINSSRPQTTPIKSNVSSPNRSQIYDHHSSTLDDFSPNKNDPSFRPKLKDSSVILLEGLKYTEPEKRPAKKELTGNINHEHDWSNMDQTSGSFAPIDETFKTTNSRYFTPLKYEAAKYPTRDVIPDSTKNLASQEAKRTFKYNRAQLSVAITENRIALDEQDKVTRALKRDLHRNTSKYHYNTLVLSDDLRLYKKTPLEMVSKKPHFSRYHRMWSGNELPDQPENRDFLSTYNASFNEDNKTIAL